MNESTRRGWSGALRGEDTTGVKGLVAVIGRTRSRRKRYEAAKQVRLQLLVGGARFDVVCARACVCVNV